MSKGIGYGAGKEKKEKETGMSLDNLLFVILTEMAVGAVVYRKKLQEVVVERLSPKVPYQEIKIKEEDVEQKYYYGQLEKKEKKI